MRAILIICLGCCITSLKSQPEKQDTNSIIFVHGQSTRQSLSEQSADPRKGDFYRNLMLSRISLDAKPNRALLTIQNGANAPIPLPQALVNGMKKGLIQAQHPSNLRAPYRYFDLIDDLTSLNGLDRNDTIFWDQLSPDYLNISLDLIYEKGFSADNSREFFRPKFLRLIWFDPNGPLGPCVLAVFPYDKIKHYLIQLTAESDQGWHRSVAEIFDLHLFQGYELPIHLDPARYPPVKR